MHLIKWEFVYIIIEKQVLMNRVYRVKIKIADSTQTFFLLIPKKFHDAFTTF